MSSSKRRTRWWSVQQWCPPMEEMEASSVAKTVACESNRLNPPQSAINNPLFSQAGLPNSLQPPGKPSVPPSHEHSDWLFLRLCRTLPNGNRSGTIFPRRERSSVRALFRPFSAFCRRLALKKHPAWSGMFTHPTSPYATAEPVPALPSIVCIVRTGHGCL